MFNFTVKEGLALAYALRGKTQWANENSRWHVIRNLLEYDGESASVSSLREWADATLINKIDSLDFSEAEDLRAAIDGVWKAMPEDYTVPQLSATLIEHDICVDYVADDPRLTYARIQYTPRNTAPKLTERRGIERPPGDDEGLGGVMVIDGANTEPYKVVYKGKR